MRELSVGGKCECAASVLEMFFVVVYMYSSVGIFLRWTLGLTFDSVGQRRGYSSVIQRTLIRLKCHQCLAQLY